MKWLLLIYRVPRTPTSSRVYVWRKLKQLGAIALQDAAWVLPKTQKTEEHLQWLAAEISEMEGDAMLWESEQIYATNSDELRARFSNEVDTQYEVLLKVLKKKGRDLKSIAKRYQEVFDRDYFQSPVGKKVRGKLMEMSGDESL